jgi:hypothetical protein
MMKKFILFFAFLGISNFLTAQDILVLKKDESVIKCRIIEITDAKVTYHNWEKTDTSTFTLKRSEVLSFLFDENSKNKNLQNSQPATIYGVEPVVKINSEETTSSKKKAKKQQNKSNQDGLLAQYKTGEIIPGYVLTNNNDTLFGTIVAGNVAMNQLEVKFTDAKGTSRTYGVEEINGYSYGTVNYRKVKSGYTKDVVNGKRSVNGNHFLHVEVTGPAMLYRFYTLKFKKSTLFADPNAPYYFGKLKNYFLITNPQGKQILTKGKTIKGSVNRLFADNKKLMEEVRMNGAKVNNLAETVQNYNTWYLNEKK